MGALKQTNIVKTHPRRWTEDDACAHPVWTSTIFKVHSKHASTWKQLGLHTVKDLIKPDCTNYTDTEILTYVHERYHEASEGGYWVKGKVWKTAAILADWRRIVAAVPQDIILAARGVLHPQEWRYNREANSIMQKMGWDGGGLGSRGQGRTEPVPCGRRAFEQSKRARVIGARAPSRLPAARR